MIKRRNFCQFKRVKLPEMNYGCRNRRYACAIVLAIERDFTLDVPVDLQNDQVYRRGKKSDIPDENLFASTNKMSRKVVGSAAIS